MKTFTNLTTITLTLLISFSGKTQSKKELLAEIHQFAFNQVNNKSYDVPREELWSVIYSLATSEYPNIKKESESKGYIVANLENDVYKEELTIEVLNDKQPFRVSYLLRREKRTKRPDGTYTSWEQGTGMNEKYLFKLNRKIWFSLYGPINYPVDLETRIEAYNSSQKKDKNKIIEGNDY